MRTLKSMSEPERRHYMSELGKLIKDVTPPDGVFILVMVGIGESPQTINYLSSGARDGMPDTLRQLADTLERNAKEQN